MISIYLFENQSDLWEYIDKIANVFIAFANLIIAGFALVFSGYIFLRTDSKEDQKEKKQRSFDLQKTFLFNETNNNIFFQFYHNVLGLIDNHLIPSMIDSEKMILNNLILDEHIKFRTFFYGILASINDPLYEKFKNETDILIDIISNKIFDDINNVNFDNLKDEIKELIIRERNQKLQVLFAL